jgi:solute carrier family 34 (sodium-dependent phosphate cotransporter)
LQSNSEREIRKSLRFLGERKSDLARAILKSIGLILFLYLFLLSISLFGDAFKLFGKDFASTLLKSTSNPIVGLFIGILATSLIQSSSTTTTIVVTMVAGGALSIDGAIPIVMGANIGTTITNTIVSLTHITHSEQFKRAFSGAIVHDIFNLLSVAVLLPLQIYTNFLGHSALFFETLLENAGGLSFGSPINAITKPVTTVIIDLLSQNAWLTAIVAIGILFIALRYMVKVLQSLVLSRVEGFFSRFVFKTTIHALLLGVIITALVQSSSITTSLMVPLVGAGVLSLRRVYPFTLGANVGTTITAILAALVTSQSAALAVALAHLMFNICGIAIFLPLSKIPIGISSWLAKSIDKSRLIPIAFILLIFFIIPLALIYLLR